MGLERRLKVINRKGFCSSSTTTGLLLMLYIMLRLRSYFKEYLCPDKKKKKRRRGNGENNTVPSFCVVFSHSDTLFSKVLQYGTYISLFSSDCNNTWPCTCSKLYYTCLFLLSCDRIHSFKGMPSLPLNLYLA